MVKYKKILLIDLDGVLNNYQEFSENYIPDVKIGTDAFLNELSKNFELYLFTTRNLLLVSKWLINNNLDKYFKNITNIKIPAYLYIDDRAICFNGNFKQTLKEIKNYKNYLKK